MASEIEIFVDIVNNRLVKGLNDSGSFAFGTLFQGSLINFKIFLVKPKGDSVTPPFFNQVAVGTLALRAAIGPRVGPTAILAIQQTWAQQLTADTDGKLNYFYGSFDLNQRALNAAIGNSDTYNSFFEIQIAEGGSWRPIAQVPITITSAVIDPTGVSDLPNPAASYATWAQLNSTFLKIINTSGAGFILQAGSFGVEFKVGPNGELLISTVQ